MASTIHGVTKGYLVIKWSILNQVLLSDPKPIKLLHLDLTWGSRPMRFPTDLTKRQR